MHLKIVQSMTVKERKTLQEAREESRKVSRQAFMTQRLDEAQSLLGNILTDKPELPKEVSRPRKVSPKRGRVPGVRDQSPATGGRDRSPVKAFDPARHRDVTPPAAKKVHYIPPIRLFYSVSGSNFICVLQNLISSKKRKDFIIFTPRYCKFIFVIVTFNMIFINKVSLLLDLKKINIDVKI